MPTCSKASISSVPPDLLHSVAEQSCATYSLSYADATRKHAVRLLRYIPGTIIGQTKSESHALWKDVGAFVGKMDQKLLELQDVPKCAPL